MTTDVCGASKWDPSRMLLLHECGREADHDGDHECEAIRCHYTWEEENI